MKTTKSPIEEAVNSNPCSKCQAAKLPKCMCAGGGSSEEEQEKNEQSELNTETQPLINTPNNIHVENLLHLSPLWQISPEQDDIYSFISNPSADEGMPIEFTIDFGMCKIECKPRPGAILNYEQEQYLKDWYQQLKDRVNNVCGDSNDITIQITGNSLFIQVKNNPQLFNKVIADLYHQNLLPGTQISPKEEEVMFQGKENSFNEPQVNESPTAPNPFNTQLTPPGYGD